MAESYDWAAFERSVFQHVDEALRRTAEAVPAECERLIRASESPLGGPQKSNPAGLQARKRRLYGHATPLLATGQLAGAQGYDVRARGWEAYVVRPPINRAEIIVKLRKRGYTVFEWSARMEARLKTELLAATDRIDAEIPRWRRG